METATPDCDGGNNRSSRDYRTHKTQDRVIADRVLTAPRVGDVTSR
jgi:hypothetical protein